MRKEKQSTHGTAHCAGCIFGRPDDFCALHVDAKTLERTFAGLAAPIGMGVVED